MCLSVLLFIVTMPGLAYAAPAIGIDLGTTMSVVSVYRFDPEVPANSISDVITNAQGNRLTPSIVSFGDEILVGESARNVQTRLPSSTMYATKRVMGKKFSDVPKDTFPFSTEECSSAPAGGHIFPDMDTFQGRFCFPFQNKLLPIETVSGLILNQLREAASQRLGDKVTDAVITVPAYFTDAQRQATLTAAQMAGLHVLQLIDEPTAAALAYSLVTTDFEKAETLLVFDLGGGTFDISILESKNGQFAVKAKGGDAMLGGEDFSGVITAILKQTLAAQGSIPSNPDKKARTFAKLRKAAEDAKKELSYAAVSTIIVDGILDGDDLELKLSRAKFEQAAKAVFDRIKPLLDQTLAKAVMNKQAIDRVLLVGGGTRMPKIHSLLKEYFGFAADSILNQDEAVANGAGILAFKIQNPDHMAGGYNVNSMSTRLALVALQDATPHTLGVAHHVDCSASQINQGGSSEIAQRLLREGGSDGDVRASLKWDTTSDLDLHIITPSTNHIYYGDKRSQCRGELDVDMNAGSPYSSNPIENIRWLQGQAPTGRFEVRVHLYHDRDNSRPIPFQLELKYNGEIKTLSGTVSSSTKEWKTSFVGGGNQRREKADGSCRKAMKVMIPAGSPLPYNTDIYEEFSTTKDSANSVNIEVLEGEKHLASENEALGRFELTGIPRKKAGEVKIGVNFKVDRNGILKANAREIGGSASRSFEVRNTGSADLENVRVRQAFKEGLATLLRSASGTSSEVA